VLRQSCGEIDSCRNLLRRRPLFHERLCCVVTTTDRSCGCVEAAPLKSEVRCDPSPPPRRCGEGSPQFMFPSFCLLAELDRWAPCIRSFEETLTVRKGDERHRIDCKGSPQCLQYRSCVIVWNSLYLQVQEI
jgi:hypothetical protein